MAGPRLMSEMMTEGAVYFRDGRRIQGRAVDLGPRLDFLGLSGIKTLQVDLAEPLMIHWAHQVPNTAAYFATNYKLVNWVLLQTSRVAVRLPLLKAAFIKAMTWGLQLMRRRLLSRIPTPLSLIVIANRQENVKHDGPRTVFYTPDGIEATVLLISAMACLLGPMQEKLKGVLTIDQVLNLDQLMSQLQQIAPDHFKMQLKKWVQ